jgi:hypothetical protein
MVAPRQKTEILGLGTSVCIPNIRCTLDTVLGLTYTILATTVRAASLNEDPNWCTRPMLRRWLMLGSVVSAA